MGIRWWESDATLSGGAARQAETTALMERVARLELALADATGTRV
jgi:hypothetical protein